LRWLPLPAAALLRAAHGPAAVVATTLAAVRPAHPGLADGELGFLALRNLAFLPWQRRANQSPVNRAVVFRLPCFVLAKVFGPFIRLKLLRIERLREARVVSHGVVSGGVVSRGVLAYGRLLVSGAKPPGLRWVKGILRAFAALRGDPGRLVFMVGVAGRAARLLHLVIDHRDDGVVGDTALTRAVVVQNVTEPKPALLH
jgi:hypothetical protein